jgi:hypothetical protein
MACALACGQMTIRPRRRFAVLTAALLALCAGVSHSEAAEDLTIEIAGGALTLQINCDTPPADKTARVAAIADISKRADVQSNWLVLNALSGEFPDASKKELNSDIVANRLDAAKKIIELIRLCNSAKTKWTTTATFPPAVAARSWPAIKRALAADEPAMILTLQYRKRFVDALIFFTYVE